MKKGKFTLVMAIVLLLVLASATTTMANEVIKTEKIDLTGDGIAETIKLVKGSDVAVVKVFNGSSGKNIFPQNRYGHIGGMHSPRTYEIINGMITFATGDLRFGCTVFFYKYYPEFAMFMEEKKVSFRNPVGKSWDDIFQNSADEPGISLVGVRTVRIFMYYLQKNQISKAKSLLDILPDSRAPVPFNPDKICKSLMLILSVNKYQYQLEDIDVSTGYSEQCYFRIMIYFPIGGNPDCDAECRFAINQKGDKITSLGQINWHNQINWY